MKKITPYMVGFLLVLIFIGFFSIKTSTASSTTIFYPTDDTILDKGSSSQIPAGNNTFMVVRNAYGAGGDTFQVDTLIKFNLSTLHNIHVLSAVLSLYYYDWDDNDPTDRPLNIYRVTSDWNETTATWSNQPTYAPQPTTYDVVPSSYGWMSWNVTNDVQLYIDNLATNYGWKITDENIWGNVNIPQTYFYSKEYGESIPALEIITTPTLVYVDNDYDASIPGWGYDHFSSIQVGIDAVAEGGTVSVYNGTYFENVNINKDGIHLLGEDKNTTIIDANGNGHGILVSIPSHGINISHFTIRNANGTGIIFGSSVQACDVQHNLISNCIVYNSSANYDDSFSKGFGILLGGHDAQMFDNSIINCEVYNNARSGIIIMRGAYSNGDNNRITACKSYNNGFLGGYVTDWAMSGITITPHINNAHLIENTIISGCEVYNNAGDGIFNGDYSVGTQIIGNRVNNNNWIGINISGTTHNDLIYYNNIQNNIKNNAYDEGTNNWYNTSIQEGNYWSDYIGTDNNQDAIGDTPFNIYGGYNQDLYPLMTPYGPPHADFTPTINDKLVTFNASYSYDYNGLITEYFWQFGDGTNGTGPIPSHLYPDYENFTVSLTVIDNDGNSNTSTQNLGIDDLIPPIISNVSCLPSDPLDTDPMFGWINITCIATDNHLVSDVRLNLTYPDESTMNISMNTAEGQCFYHNTTFIQVGMYHYFLWVSDAHGNTCSSSNSEFLMPPNWDIDIDGACNLLDMILISNHYAETGPCGWLREDVNNDGSITVLDLVIESNYYEQQWLQKKSRNLGTLHEETVIFVNPSNQTVTYGEDFTINIFYASGQPIKGWESYLQFNSSLITVNSVIEEDFFSGYNTFFNPGTIDNTNGTIASLYDFIIGAGNASQPRPFIGIFCTAGSLPGTSYLNLTNVGVCNETSYLPLTVYNGMVEITPNNQPYLPSNPYPPENANNIDTTVTVSWTGGDPDPDDTVTYDIYFGTTNPPPKAINNMSGPTSYEFSSLEYETQYYWKIVSWDNHGATISGPLWQFTTKPGNAPPDAPLINGPTSGNAGEEYTYTFVAVDPNDDNIYYQINWGDGQVDDWYGPCSSNLVITRTHTWSEKGTYLIQARAKDIDGAIGEWGSLSVTMPLDVEFSYHSSQQILSFQLKKIMS
jgi:nitrous oxidase accessory protein NosD